MASGRYSGDQRVAEQIITDERKATVRRQFPGEYLDSTYDQIAAAAAAGNKRAQTAKKLLDSKKYDKRVE